MKSYMHAILFFVVLAGVFIEVLAALDILFK